MSQLEDMTAINAMFRRTKPNNPTSNAIKSSWISWYDKLQPYHRAESNDVLKEAKQRRDNFFKAEALSNPAPTGKSVSKPMADTPILLPGPRPTLRVGIHKTDASTKPHIVEWQNVIRVTPDGLFGPNTQAKTIAWQRARGLTADGIVGPMTWSRAQLESTQAMASAANLPQAAAQAVDQIAQATQAAQVAAASKPTPAAKAAAVAQSVAKSAQAAVAQAANVAVGRPAAPVATSSRIPMPSPVATVTESVSAKVTELASGTPVWIKAVVATGLAFSTLIGLKLAMGAPKKRAA